MARSWYRTVGAGGCCLSGRIQGRYPFTVKNGASASLTANQGMLFPVLWDYGLCAQGTAAARAGLVGLKSLPGFVVWLS